MYHFVTRTIPLGTLFIIMILTKCMASTSVTIDFTEPSEHQKWLATNDNVMGGLSVGQLTYNENLSQFHGKLSLANNGGFSSINRPIGPLKDHIDSIKLSFIGDGRTYQLRFTTWINGTRINYKHDFVTTQGKTQTKTFILNDFQAVFRGRLLLGTDKLMSEDIKQMGFLIADKQTQPFTLSLLKVEFITL